MRGLRSRMDYRTRLHFSDKFQHVLPIPNINLVMNEARQLRLEPMLIPSRVPTWAKERRTRVVINAMNQPALT
jgi:hypothetical protein